MFCCFILCFCAILEIDDKFQIVALPKMAAAGLTVVLVPRDSAALGEDSRRNPGRIAGGRDSERSHQGNNISHFFSSSGVFFLSRFNMDTVPHNPGPCRFGK